MELCWKYCSVGVEINKKEMKYQIQMIGCTECLINHQHFAFFQEIFF